MAQVKSRLSESILDRLRDIVGEEHTKTTVAELYVYAFDASIHRSLPDVVVQPRTTDEVAQVVKLANEHKIPLVPRGAGTALCGHSVPIAGGIVVDMQPMNQIEEVRVEDLYAVAGPGVVCNDFNAALKPYKFFIPGPASSEAATLGGMVACNASGAKALKYGATRDYVLGLEVVLPTGDVAHMGTRTVKNASGYQLERLITGSEGTLGIITKIIMRVAPLPRAKAAAMAAFNDLEQTGQAVANLVAHPLFPERMELMSADCIKAVNKATGLGLPECQGILLIEVGGSPAGAKEDIQTVGKVCKETGAFSIDFTDDESQIEALFLGRKQMIPSLSALNEAYATVMLADDMAVPVSQVPKAVAGFKAIQDKYDILIPAYGHAGDGNLHTKVLMDPTNPDHWRQADQACKEVYDLVLELGGTVTGEHGIAITKSPFFRKERASCIDTMKSIKKALDPNNIMNPFKIMDWEKGMVTHLRYPVEVEEL